MTSTEAVDPARGVRRPQSLEGEVEDPWGDIRLAAHSSPNLVRIAFLNIHGLPVSRTAAKNISLFNFITSQEIDIIGLSELNLHWPSLSVADRWSERTRRWWRKRLALDSCLLDWDRRDKQQYGGSALLVRDETVATIHTKGTDTLGRWSWVAIRGRRGSMTYIVSVYRPCHSLGPTTVYQQQRTAMLRQGQDLCPLLHFSQALSELLSPWVQAGHSVVVGGDFNGDITPGSSLWTMFHRLHLSLAGHPRLRWGTAPPSHRSGSSTIDGIFVTSNLLHCRAGLMPAPSFTDHRWPWIDLPLSLILGRDLGHPSQPSSSPARLQLHDPRIVHRFTSSLSTSLGTAALDRLRHLDSQVGATITPPQERVLEELDKLFVEAVWTADGECRQIRLGAIPWSPEFSDAAGQCHTWVAILRHCRRAQAPTSYDRRQYAKVGLTPGEITTPDAASKVREVYAAYRALTKTAQRRRHFWLEELAKAREQAKEGTAATLLRQMVQIEEVRTNARRIKWLLGKQSTRGGLGSVVAPCLLSAPSGPWHEVFNPEHINQALIWEKERRFRQAEDTPALREPLRTFLGPTAKGPGTAAILYDANPRLPSLPPDIARIPAFWAAGPAVQTGLSAPPSWDKENYAQAWRRARATTACGYSKLTFSHFKAVAAHPTLSTFSRLWSNLSYRTGYCPSRWRRGLNVMLEKKPGVLNVDKLRTILLYEPDFNMNNKKLGRDMMRFAEQHQLLAPEQYGSRKSKEAADHGLNKLLTFDIIRQRRYPAAVASNDAKSCYDRIVHSVATLCMERSGAPRPAVDSMFGTIQQMQHFVKTAHGTSLESFGGPTCPPCYTVWAKETAQDQQSGQW